MWEVKVSSENVEKEEKWKGESRIGGERDKEGQGRLKKFKEGQGRKERKGR